MYFLCMIAPHSFAPKVDPLISRRCASPCPWICGQTVSPIIPAGRQVLKPWGAMEKCPRARRRCLGRFSPRPRAAWPGTTSRREGGAGGYSNCLCCPIIADGIVIAGHRSRTTQQVTLTPWSKWSERGEERSLVAILGTSSRLGEIFFF